MASRIRIKLGVIEVEYEGEHDFLEKDLLALVKDLIEMTPVTPPPKKHDVEVDPGNRGGQAGQAGGSSGTVSTFAARLSVTTGPQLILAALLQAAKVGGNASLSRKDILAAMQSAKSHYKTSYRSNLSTYLKSLTRSGDINEVGTDMYALSNPKKDELEEYVAQA